MFNIAHLSNVYCLSHPYQSSSHNITTTILAQVEESLILQTERWLLPRLLRLCCRPITAIFCLSIQL